jgi:hypothetical protein
MRKLTSALREPAVAGLVFLAGLLLISWPFWSEGMFATLSGDLAYLFGVWVVLIALNFILSMGWEQTPGSPEATEHAEAKVDDEEGRV